MLGFFAIYTGRWADRAQRPETDQAPGRSPFGLLPHEIAALNAR
ncbi:MAG: hypothetical protein ACFBWO_05255 [Paracoccaceae bacterium]